MNSREILIVGGYGVVGRRIAVDLAPDYPGRVVVAGRNLARADEVATAIGHGARGRRIDIALPSSIAAALDGVAVVISCIDQPKRALMWGAIERGLRYTDISPHLTELGNGAAYEKVDAAARASGARVVLGTGIVPGISNVMVRVLADELGGADKIETALLLSAGDVTGPASFDYFLQELSMSFEMRIDGEDRAARAFTAPQPVEFPPPAGVQLSYLFPFSDQVLYPRTMGATTALTRLAIEPAWVSRLLAVLVGTGASGLMATKWVRHAHLAPTQRSIVEERGSVRAPRGRQPRHALEERYSARRKQTRQLQAPQEWLDCFSRGMLLRQAPGCRNRSLNLAHFSLGWRPLD